MQQAGMGYEAEVRPHSSVAAEHGDQPKTDDPKAIDLLWRSQTCPGKTGIPAFKLRSNDRWLVTVLLRSYAVTRRSRAAGRRSP
jgi:hypothetical protein